MKDRPAEGVKEKPVETEEKPANSIETLRRSPLRLGKRSLPTLPRRSLLRI